MDLGHKNALDNIKNLKRNFKYIGFGKILRSEKRINIKNKQKKKLH